MLEPGTEVGGYRIDGVLGVGGMGAVYAATQLSLKRRVALKILASELAQDESFRERFRREGEIQASIDHPHIVTIYEAGRIETDKLFIAMRLIVGSSLKDMIVGRDLEAARTLRILRPIADALDTAHQFHLIHRDIKPQNILVDARDRAFLADFGLTKGVNDTGLTRTGQFVGTIDYISPEQIRGEPATSASDIYAMAAVLYECLTGVVPYPKPSDAAVLYAHLGDPPPLVTDQRPDLPVALDDVLARAMAKDPADRHPTATDLIDDAERGFGRKIRAALTPPGPIETPEEAGIRESEVKVPTRETRVRQLPGDPGTALPPLAPPAPGDSEVSRAAQAAEVPVAPETRAAPAVGDVAPETRAAPAVGDVAPQTRAAPAPAAAGPAATPSSRAASESGRRPRGAGSAKRVSSERRDRRPPVLAGALALAIIAIAGVAGLLIGSPGEDVAPPPEPGPPALSNSASSEALELGVPAGWRRAPAAEAIPGFEPEDAVALTAREPAGAGVLAGRTEAAGAALLSRDLLRRLAEPPGEGERVRLGELQAYRYDDLRLSDSSKRLRVYASPTSAGVATVACFAEEGDARAYAPVCDRIAQSVRVLRGEPRRLGPDAQYAAAVNRSIGRLRDTRGRTRARLARARTPRAQARELEALADAYRRADRGLRSASPGPAERVAHAEIVSAVRSAAKGYARMATAAARNRGGAYREARTAVASSEQQLKDELARLRRLGYRVR